MSTDNLKKCPFCGGEAEITTEYKSEWTAPIYSETDNGDGTVTLTLEKDGRHGIGKYYRARCRKCKSQTLDYDCEEMAAYAWNHRTPEWIKFTEELEEVPEDDPEWGEPRWQFTCETPEDGQEILTARKTKYGFRIELDMFYEDEEGCALESDASFEDDEIWWMPLPEPPQEN